ncbi:dnaJ homolog subfamily B member 14-like [Arabidopsis lyrata subsp. lyrata]|uniref:dnaJ homolog subfamily B member 14-like n=1 Tax=Arabidopsis lyrata subsp. lyrata TaxID=81972 RepID=UPI000A29DFED|nr:dnaJ homolog subfamily B member 14-like [Arabidopsis lyrata subsp. lyrata]|eukprot:XP_020872593.1 dnaJ homolog subfamily B member 14-like [Arabidopsis lyrata subsp. lyrata]
MESNKEEARRALDYAERKLSKNDYHGAKKFVTKAQALYPKLGGLEQVLIMIDVYISAPNGEADWYGIIGVDPLADDEAVKKQYKKLALLLHPDKNRFNGAEGAFKLVLQAWCLLSDKANRIAYDQKRRPNQVKQKESGRQKPPKRHEYKPYGARSEPKHEPKTPESKIPEPNKPKRLEPKKPEPKKPEPKNTDPEIYLSEEILFTESREKIAADFAVAAAGGNANKAKRIYKKLTRLGNPNPNLEAERLFEEYMTECEIRSKGFGFRS